MQVNVFTIQLVLVDTGKILIYLMVGNYTTCGDAHPILSRHRI